jgi:hypothetical protein
MSTLCEQLHHFFNALPRHTFPFAAAAIPLNGLYVLFEEGEDAHGGQRIVRVGTHTGDNQLRSRLAQHFLQPNKDRSIFRKNIGRALLNRDNDPFLASWELDLTTSAAKLAYAGKVDPEQLREAEERVSQRIQQTFSFAVVAVPVKEERLRLESRIISTVSQCTVCAPSATWLGHCSPKQKICSSGLWLVNELYKEPCTDLELTALRAYSGYTG